MEVQALPLGSVTVGAASWRDGTARAVRRAERLVRQTRAGTTSALSRPQTSSASVTLPGSAEDTTPEPHGPGEKEKRCDSGRDEHTTPTRPRTTATTLLSCSRRSAGGAPFPGTALREACAGASVATAGGYMRAVRCVEAELRTEAGRVAQEAGRLQRERGLLEQTLRSLRSHLGLNRSSSRHRTKRDTRESVTDGADELLQCERRELLHLKQELEETLSSTLTQIQSLSLSSRRLLSCASERALVLELLPLSGSGKTKGGASRGASRGATGGASRGASRGATGGAITVTQDQTLPNPTGPYTPECKEALDSSCSCLKESQRLRQTIRQKLSSALLRQRAVQQMVNDGLLKKVAETISLQQSLGVMCGATRQALYRKQREMDLILHSHGRAQGPEYSGDVLSRERLDRPLVQVYHRHPGTQLPEAAQLIQGSAMLARCFSSRQAEFDRLQHTSALLHSDLQRKSAAAAVDSAVLRMRRRHVDKRAVPVFLQQDALRSSTALSCAQ
ncbi:hypothetical protein NQD34_012385 [Periophthalmus magnuspinnatus]|nr:hypothetical protein NQD34_012385 [Periophthalmus magnuspinnatus]